MYCSYYIVAAQKHMIWLLVAHLKSHDNIAFHRTMEGTGDCMLEFFVPPAQEETLVRWLALYQEEGFIFSYRKEKNRLAS